MQTGPGDVADRAVFVAAKGEVVIGKPLNITIPQYAWYSDDSGKKPAIVIQAEDANGQHFVGARLRTGERVAGFAADFVLLGKTTHPKKP